MASRATSSAESGSFTRRSYSFYDPPPDDNGAPASEVGFLVKRLSGGRFSEGLFSQDRTGTRFWMEVPFGIRGVDEPDRDGLCVVVDNDSTRQHATVQDGLAAHPRFHMYFTPTSASWLNRVERFFRDLTTDRLRRGVFRSVPELIAAIEHYVEHHHEQPKPFIWTAKANDILQKVIRPNARLSSKQNEALHEHAEALGTAGRVIHGDH